MVEEGRLSLVLLHARLHSSHHMHVSQGGYLGSIPKHLQLLLCFCDPALCHVMVQKGPVAWELGHAVKSSWPGHLARISVGAFKEQQGGCGRGGASQSSGHLVHKHHLVHLVPLSHLLWCGHVSHDDPIVLGQSWHVDDTSACGHFNTAIVVRLKDAEAPVKIGLLAENWAHIT